MKIIVLDGYAANPGDLSWDALAALGELTVYDRTDAKDVVSRIGDAQVILTNKTLITQAVLEACPSLRYVGVLATGYNVVDLEAAKQQNVVVTNIPAYSTAAVAQFTFALLLELCHRVGHHADAVAQGRWTASEHFCFWDYPLMELAGKTIGLIGYGQIGQATAAVARALGMKVLAYTPRGNGPDFVPLETLLKESDVISLHCPLTPANQGMINRETIAQMKDGVLLLNTARGGLIVDQDLRDALLSGKIAAAAVDVATAEPIPADNPLLGLENCLITPHIAWAPKEARIRLMNIAVENVRQFLAGTPVNQVN